MSVADIVQQLPQIEALCQKLYLTQVEQVHPATLITVPFLGAVVQAAATLSCAYCNLDQGV